MELLRWLSGKESASHEGDTGLIPGSERSPREENGRSLQYPYLGNPRDRGAGRTPWGFKESMGFQRVHGVSKSWTQLTGYTAAACMHYAL